MVKNIFTAEKISSLIAVFGLANIPLIKFSIIFKPCIVSIDSGNRENKSILSNLWFSNGLTAAASILLTLFIINNVDISRMNISEDSTNKIASAINSKEAKDIAERSEEYLIDHILNVINDPNYMNTQEAIDLRNVGFRHNVAGGYKYSNGKENFQLRVEKKNLGLKKIRYWKHGKKMIYVVPLSDGRVVTLYGNISASSARNLSLIHI